MVVRKGSLMNKDEKPVQSIDWAAIFKRRPDLRQPGCYETIAKLYPKEGSK